MLIFILLCDAPFFSSLINWYAFILSINYNNLEIYIYFTLLSLYIYVGMKLNDAFIKMYKHNVLLNWIIKLEITYIYKKKFKIYLFIYSNNLSNLIHHDILINIYFRNIILEVCQINSPFKMVSLKWNLSSF